MRDEIRVKITTLPADQVDLEGSDIQDDEINEIITTIKQHKPNVERIFLAKNQIGTEGAKLIAHEFKSLKQLSQLDLQYNQIGKDGLAELTMLKVPGFMLALGGNEVIDTTEMKEIQDIASSRFKPIK